MVLLLFDLLFPKHYRHGWLSVSNSIVIFDWITKIWISRSKVFERLFKPKESVMLSNCTWLSLTWNKFMVKVDQECCWDWYHLNMVLVSHLIRILSKVIIKVIKCTIYSFQSAIQSNNKIPFANFNGPNLRIFRIIAFIHALVSIVVKAIRSVTELENVFFGFWFSGRRKL